MGCITAQASLRACARTTRRTVRRSSVSTRTCGGSPRPGRHMKWISPYSFEQLCAASIEVIRANKLENAYLRPLAFYDSRSFSVWPKGCPISVTIIAVPGKPYIPGGPEQGIRVTVSTVRRIDAATLPPFVKACGHYTNSVRAAQEAMRRGYDDAVAAQLQGRLRRRVGGESVRREERNVDHERPRCVDRHGHHARQRSPDRAATSTSRSQCGRFRSTTSRRRTSCSSLALQSRSRRSKNATDACSATVDVRAR